ncbi:YiiX/YebB-like N1pC/P60 family cysteine hydrolase [Pseudomonas chlororaphis]|uniref:YiiX/YebB-like N1pC/P60 family cysteine hydrolase n=1 Tax=Pseudomonas TaxID=286 RepID=UPI00338D8872
MAQWPGWKRTFALLLSAQAGYAVGAPSLPPNAMAGDLIFREGTEVVSAAVMAVDHGAFTHVGILVGSSGNWQVLHATPSEVQGRPDGVVLDTLDFFLDTSRSKQYGIFHVEASKQQRADSLRAARKMLGRPFRIADPAGTYCTELVWDAWRSAGVDLQVQFTHIELPMLPGSYLLPSALLASPKIHHVGADPRRQGPASTEPREVLDR